MLTQSEQDAITAHVLRMKRMAVLYSRKVKKQEMDARTAKAKEQELLDDLRDMLKEVG